MGGTLQEEQKRSGGRPPGPVGPGNFLSSQAAPPKAPSRSCGSWGHRREAGEISRGRQEGPLGRSRRGAEGDCPDHSGPGSLLSSQAGTLPSKAPPSPHHHTGTGDIGGRPRRSGEAGVRGSPRPQTRGAGEERRTFALPTQAQEACWAPM